jgi:hypothetical protein
MQQINRIQGNIPDIGFEIFMYICEHGKKENITKIS